MKIGISSTGQDLEANVDVRFGRCKYFIILDTESMDFEALPNESVAASGGAGIQAAQTLVKQDLMAVLTGNMGPNAFQTLTAAGLKVITGVNGTIRDAVDKFKKGFFKEADSPSVDNHSGLGGNKNIKVGVPTMGDKGMDESIGEHFGRVPTYTIVDLDTNEVTVIPNTSHHMGGQGQPPEILGSKGIQVMLCRGLGGRAISLFQDFGIDVYIGVNGTVRDAIDAFKLGRLQKAEIGNACERHAFKDQHHHC